MSGPTSSRAGGCYTHHARRYTSAVQLASGLRKKIIAVFDGGRLSSDGGVLLLAGADRRRGLADMLARLIPDHRSPPHITHALADTCGPV